MKTLKKIALLALPALIVAVGMSVLSNKAVYAAACTNSANYGLVTKTVNVPAAGDYRIWSRIKVPSAANSTYQLEANGNTCWQVGGSNVPTNTWTWVDWYGGNATQKVNYTFSTAGNYPLKLIGAATDVQVDKVILLGVGEQCSDGGTVPSGDGSNCASAPVPPTITSFAASPATVTVSNTTTFNWVTSNTSSCSVTPNGPTNTTSKSWTTLAFTSTGTKTYTLTCKNALGTQVTATANVTVNAAPTPPSNVKLTASATSVTSGTLVNLSWTSTGGTSCTLNPGNYTASGSGSNRNVTVTNTTTYTVSCSNNAGSTTSSGVTVNVVATPPPPANPVINSFVATPTSVAYNGKTRLTWSSSNVSTNGCVLTSTLNGSPVSYPATSEYTSAELTASISYTLTCKNSAGTTTNKSVSVTVANKPAPPAPTPTPSSQIPATPPSSTNNGTTTVKATTGQEVVAAQNSEVLNQGDLVTLDTSTVTDKAKVDSIQKIEFYDGEALVQTVTQAPFVLDTKKLSAGSHTITQRTYYKDGSSSTQSQLIEVQGMQDVQGAVVSKNAGGTLAVGIGSVIALIIAIAFAGWFFMLRPLGYTLKESVVLVVSKTGSFIGKMMPGKSTPEVPKVDTDKSYYAEPTVISPDDKKDLK